MSHIVLCDSSDLYFILSVVFLQGNLVSCFHTDKRSRFFTDHRSIIGKLILLVGLSVTQCYILFKIFRIFRNIHIDTDTSLFFWCRHLGELHTGIVIDLAVSVQEFQKILFLAVCGILIIDHHGIIVLDLVILENCNIHNGIIKSESYKHQSHASCNSENGHKKTLFITEKISHGRFPGKAQMLPDKADPFNKDPFSFFRCRRTHQRCRCFCQGFCAGKQCSAHSTDHRCPGSDQCIL